MPLPTYYNTGVASVDSGATTVNFTGAALGTDELPSLRAGDLFFDPAQPAIPGQRIASIDYDAGTATLWAGWPGDDMDDAPYEVRFVDDGVRSTAQTRRYLEALGQLQATGVKYDAYGWFADRPVYDDQKPPFIYLSLDGNGDDIDQWMLFAKLSDASGDWDGGQTVEGPKGDDGDPAPTALDDLTDVDIDEPAHGDQLRYDAAAEEWINVTAAGWHVVAISGGAITMDIDDGDKFAVVVNADAEIAMPANSVPGAPIALRLKMSGTHAVTFAAGWQGVPPAVLTADSDETVLAGIVLDTEPAVTGVLNLVKAIPA